MSENEQSQQGSTALTIRNQNTAVGQVTQAMAVEEILAQVRLIQEVMGKVMTEGEHYGQIPGTGEKKTLLQPGAQKLTMTFRLAPQYAITRTDMDRGHRSYEVTCTLKSIQSGAFLGEGVGCCSTMESKYRFRNADLQCPACGKHTIIASKEEYGGGWLCFKKKGGCGAKFEHNEPKITSQPRGKVESDNPADFYNTVLKMAKKRAFVDATITATAASDIFTQDIGDDEGFDKPQDTPPEAARNVQKPAPPPKPVPPVKTPPAATTAPAKATADELRTWLKGYCDKFLAMAKGETKWAWWAHGVESGWIMPNERLEAARPEDVFKIDWSKSTKENTPNVRDQYIRHVAAISDLYEGKNRQEGLPTAEEYKAKFAVVYADPQPEATVTQVEQPWACPHCSSTATHESKDYDDTLVCEACGWQWDEKTGQPWEEHKWASIICPIPPKGMTKKEYDESPITLGQIMRTDSKRFYGLTMNNQEAKGWTGKDGKTYQPSAADVRFCEACKAAVEHMNASKENTP